MQKERLILSKFEQFFRRLLFLPLEVQHLRAKPLYAKPSWGTSWFSPARRFCFRVHLASGCRLYVQLLWREVFGSAIEKRRGHKQSWIHKSKGGPFRRS